MGTAGLIESFELRQLNLVILSAAHSDISVRIISHEITSALSDCIHFFYDMTASKAFSSSHQREIFHYRPRVHPTFLYLNILNVFFFQRCTVLCLIFFPPHFDFVRMKRDQFHSHPFITMAHRSRDAWPLYSFEAGKAISVLGIVTLQSS